MPGVETLLVYVIGAMGYSLVTFVSKNVNRSDPEPFRLKPFVRALLVGVVVGLYAFSVGADLSLASFPQLVQASGAAVIADQGVKLIWRYLDLGNRLGIGQYLG